MKNSIDVQFGEFADSAALRKLIKRSAVQKWVNHALAKPGEITVRMVGEAEAHSDFARLCQGVIDPFLHGATL